MSKHKFHIILPLRKNSKRIKNKNTIRINKKMLFEYTLEKINIKNYNYITYISSDDAKIERWCRNKNIIYSKRSKGNSSDFSTTENAIVETINNNKKFITIDNYSHIILLQCTSPLRNSNDIEKCIKFYLEGKYDSVFSGVYNKNLFWKKYKGKLTPINYNFLNRKREQDMKYQIIENGSMYIFNTKKFLKYRNRLFGKIGIYPMSKLNSLQIDEKEDILLLKKFLK